MANMKLTPEELAELVNSTPEMREFAKELAKSAVFSTLGEYLGEPGEATKPRGGLVGYPTVKFDALYGSETIRPSSSAIRGKSAHTVIIDDLLNTTEAEAGAWYRDQVFGQLQQRREAEEREAHYKGDPLAGSF